MKRFTLLSIVVVVFVLLVGVGFLMGQTARAQVADPAVLLPATARLMAPVESHLLAQTGDPDMDAKIAAFVGMVVNAVIGLVTLGFASPLVVLLTNLIKRFLPETIGGGAISLAVSVVIWVIYAIATRLGFSDQFQSVVGIVFQLLTILLPLFGLQVATGQVFDYAAKKKLALTGYQRSVPKYDKAVG